MRRTPILIGGAGEKVLLRIAAQHADIWNNLAVFQAQLGAKVEALRRRCDDVKRDLAEIRVSQQCVVVIEEDEARARESLEKAKKIYGGHMGARARGARHLGHARARDRVHREAPQARLRPARDRVLRPRHARARAPVRRARAARLRQRVTRFERDTAVARAGDGVYDVRIDGGWWIVVGPNGGYLAALVLRALQRRGRRRRRARRAR